jgi:hypothetical protein
MARMLAYLPGADAARERLGYSAARRTVAVLTLVARRAGRYDAAAAAVTRTAATAENVDASSAVTS